MSNESATHENTSVESNAAVWQTLRGQPLQVDAWLELARDYAQRQLPWHLSYVQSQVERMPAEPAQAASREEVAGLSCASPPEHWQTVQVLSQPAGQAAGFDVERVSGELRAHLEAHPSDWLSWLYLARCLDWSEPVPVEEGGGDGPTRTPQHAAVLQALGSEVFAGETGHMLAMWRLRSGDVGGALAALQAVLNQAPQRHGSWLLLAEALMLAGQVEEAKQAFERAGVSQNPRFLELLASKLMAFQFFAEALAVLEAVVRLDPANVVARDSLNQVRNNVQQMSTAVDTLQ